MKRGVDSTIDPTFVLYVKTITPDYQSVKNSGYNIVTSSNLSYKNY